MKPRFLALLLLIMLISSHSRALDYEITSVIEVGEADFHPYLSPVIWSPDGTMLAFTKGGVIKISDTLGNVRDIIKLDMPIHRWDWVSDEQIAVYMRKFTGQGISTIEHLSTIDINLKREAPVHHFNTFHGHREIDGFLTSTGPYKTVERNNYYQQTTYQGKGKKPVNKQLSFIPNKSESIKNDRFLRWSDSGLYLVRLDGTDSTWLAEKPRSHIVGPTYINNDLSLVLMRGLVIRLKDSTRITLRDKIGPLPPKTVQCGFVWYSINPVLPEILLTISCDDGDNYIVNRVATFDLETNLINDLDSLTGISNSSAPVYSSDGIRISFFANGKVYILNREVH